MIANAIRILFQPLMWLTRRRSNTATAARMSASADTPYMATSPAVGTSGLAMITLMKEDYHSAGAQTAHGFRQSVFRTIE